ncbi:MULTISPECIES: ABC transporter substrate-binding protein [unclassified Rhodococcus (in: high G+C Gram-positive bacteria)]|jgi:polar amino acid transport system substrate-binding protein|uniref:ABC transporter substrate-binding protein n=1 Tax=unclassified Rhodococcus (in: high G+C Gram-positive bacteria) TaxID=192944 RepID=UPI000483FF1D|nr:MULTISPECIES: ABC transporter substrate-binding protein [unclassified Rhodococcus (in: high G+C Gram-positive bacteria)]MBY6677683.1 ABC transporter substrate-binding protein [Rhodococcus sp. BP-332]MBY6680929.1 ABC transporter substrate-binding protein [Rhodococcus sp. BP-316]MBY6684294.1 ABC transporter substrate-binding protein [Rhodococcus sp. BP-288]MBY6693045.1 ABC transporter substrate-binding protein [Rhodococcus sp. BP-188]MBY6697242.1 ABC transporter substrate-binding protein [Rho
MSRSSRRLASVLSSVAVLALVASACGEPAAENTVVSEAGVSYDLSPEQSGRIHTEKVDDIAAKVPQAIRDRGTLVVTGTAGATPPLGFYATDDTTVVGSEIDLASLFADVLGLSVDRRTADWAQNFVKIDSGENDAFISNVTVTEERKEKYDFATYRLDNVALEVPTDSDWTFTDRKDIAGKKIGVSSGTNQEQLLVDWNTQNGAEGIAPAEIVYYQNAADYYLALSSKRIDGYLGPNPSAQYHSSSTGESKIIGTFSGAGEALQGEIAVLVKKDSGLAEAFADAIDHTIENGTYQQVLDKWGLGGEAVSASEINPPGLPKK